MEANDNAQNFKIVLVGETGKVQFKLGVGKTSIISRFVNDKFDPNFMTTSGASFASKSVYSEEYDRFIQFEVL